MARVAVTGGSGRLGRAVVTDLAAHGYDVLNPRPDGSTAGPAVDFVSTDLTDYGQVLGLPFDTPPPYVSVDEQHRGRPETTYSLGKAVEEEMAWRFCRWAPQASMVGRRFSNVMESAGYAAFPSYDADPPGIPGSTASLSRMLRRCQTPGPHLQPPRAATRREASTVALQDHERDGGSSGSRRPFLCVVPDGRDHRGRIPGFGTSAAGMIVTSPA